MNFGTSGSESESSSKPEVWEGIEPYLTGGPGGYSGPTDRYRPMQINPDWESWNQQVGNGLFVGPPPEMASYDPNAYGGGGRTNTIGDEEYVPPAQQQQVAPPVQMPAASNEGRYYLGTDIMGAPSWGDTEAMIRNSPTGSRWNRS